MDILRMLAELRQERARLDEAIVSLEKLSLTGAPRRGRPPEWSRMANADTSQKGNGQNGSMKAPAMSASQE